MLDWLCAWFSVSGRKWIYIWAVHHKRFDNLHVFFFFHMREYLFCYFTPGSVFTRWDEWFIQNKRKNWAVSMRHSWTQKSANLQKLKQTITLATTAGFLLCPGAHFSSCFLRKLKQSSCGTKKPLNSSISLAVMMTARRLEQPDSLHTVFMPSFKEPCI